VALPLPPPLLIFPRRLRCYELAPGPLVDFALLSFSSCLVLILLFKLVAENGTHRWRKSRSFPAIRRYTSERKRRWDPREPLRLAVRLVTRSVREPAQERVICLSFQNLLRCSAEGKFAQARLAG
jgi:hypothetical protein